MKFPICTFDAKTGILCPICDDKLQSGAISKTDVEVSGKLVKLMEKITSLEKVSLQKAFTVNGDYVLAFGHGDLLRLKSESGIIKKLSEALNRRVWLIEAETTDRKMLEDLVFPIRVLTVNVVWLPDGSKMTKMVIPGRRTSRFPIDLDRVKAIAKTVRGIELLVEFEKQ